MVSPAEVRVLLVDDMEQMRNILGRLPTVMGGFVKRALDCTVANARLSLMSDTASQKSQ